MLAETVEEAGARLSRAFRKGGACPIRLAHFGAPRAWKRLRVENTVAMDGARAAGENTGAGYEGTGRGGIAMDAAQGDVAVVILAAGKGTRMKSTMAKVLHPIHGKSMVEYVVETARKVAGKDVVVVVGHQAEKVREVVSAKHPVAFALQEEQRGTGHAVQCAMPEVARDAGNVVVLCGDVPLITARSVTRLVERHTEEGAAVTVLAMEVEEPRGYGRMVTGDGGEVTGIVEEADATDEERKIRTVNAGVYCVARGFLEESLGQLRDENAQGELYLTDIVRIAHDEGRKIGMMKVADPREVIGVNSPAELAKVAALMASGDLKNLDFN